MAILKKKAEPTLEDRINSAEATAESAVSLFEVLALDLDVAATELEKAREDAVTEADRLAVLGGKAFASARQRREQAKTIRGFLGGDK